MVSDGRYRTCPPLLVKNYVDPKNRPFAVFEFRYRSNKGLIRECIIPRAPTATDEVQGMSEDQLRQRLAQVLKENQRLAQEVAERKVIESKSIGIKREVEVDEDKFVAKYKARKLDNGRLEIDLTDD
ncbi:hypothetical protein VTJ49DRAFT_2547 [Mycothermus thermophilus]|uniref:DUF7918 domain-containing protein n=1 Tax=Humicola insolens TaxID=85995 RepID=A0ABR3VA00_HUMIN